MLDSIFLLISSTSACSFSRLALLCSGVKLSTCFISLRSVLRLYPLELGFLLLVLPYSYPPIILMFVYFCALHQMYVTTLNRSWWGSSDEGHHII